MLALEEIDGVRRQNEESEESARQELDGLKQDTASRMTDLECLMERYSQVHHDLGSRLLQTERGLKETMAEACKTTERCNTMFEDATQRCEQGTATIKSLEDDLCSWNASYRSQLLRLQETATRLHTDLSSLSGDYVSHKRDVTLWRKHLTGVAWAFVQDQFVDGKTDLAPQFIEIQEDLARLHVELSSVGGVADEDSEWRTSLQVDKWRAEEVDRRLKRCLTPPPQAVASGSARLSPRPISPPTLSPGRCLANSSYSVLHAPSACQTPLAASLQGCRPLSPRSPGSAAAPPYSSASCGSLGLTSPSRGTPR